MTGEDIPDVVDDDLLLEEELSPAARVCSPLGRRLVRNAHRNLGHPSRYASPYENGKGSSGSDCLRTGVQMPHL